MNRVEFGKYVRAEMDKWNLHDWDYSYGMNWKRRLGQCIHHEKYLIFSLPYVDCNPIDTLMDTIRHEIGHALVGPGHRHGPVWKALASTVGYIPRACNVGEIDMPSKYIATCGCPDKIHRWHRKPRASSYKCKLCRSTVIPQLAE